jgi:hypothetical protein
VSGNAPDFDPTRSPPRRLVRLGIVFDGRLAPDAVAPLARMCDRAGIDIVWVADAIDGTTLVGDLDAWSVSASLMGGLRDLAVGALVDNRRSLADLAGLMQRSVGEPRPGTTRFELGLGDAGELSGDIRNLREAMVRVGVELRVSAVVRSTAQVAPLLAVVDDIVLSAWHIPDLETAADETRAAALDVGRDPSSLGVGALVPVSVGRTDAEAAARAEMDPDFARHGNAAEIGIFGTLEACQDRVIALAHAGISDLRCVLPATPDIHDVIAQLTAMTIGTVDVLTPGSLRSPAPPPPEGWGGRPDRPPAPRVSAGSRRRG